MKLTVGFVPEHFSTPLFLAERQGFFLKHGLEVEFKPFISGTGQLIQSLNNGEINIAVGLTEAFVTGIATRDVCYQIIGSYVDSPLCWSINTGGNRDDLTSDSQLEGSNCGISRFGSGSDVMSKVFREERRFKKEFNYEVLDNFANLREGVVNKKADFFMWEHFTSKRYYDNGEIKKIGEIYTPWPSWVIVADNVVFKYETIATAFIKSVNEGIDYFYKHLDEAIRYIVSHFDYTEETAREWLQTVEYTKDARNVDPKMIANTLRILNEAIKLPEDYEEKEYIKSP